MTSSFFTLVISLISLEVHKKDKELVMLDNKIIMNFIS